MRRVGVCFRKTHDRCMCMICQILRDSGLQLRNTFVFSRTLLKSDCGRLCSVFNSLVPKGPLLHFNASSRRYSSARNWLGSRRSTSVPQAVITSRRADKEDFYKLFVLDQFSGNPQTSVPLHILGETRQYRPFYT
jgi:hypothetical protein